MKFTSEIIFNLISHSLSVELNVIYFSILSRTKHSQLPTPPATTGHAVRHLTLHYVRMMSHSPFQLPPVHQPESPPESHFEIRDIY